MNPARPSAGDFAAGASRDALGSPVVWTGMLLAGNSLLCVLLLVAAALRPLALVAVLVVMLWNNLGSLFRGLLMHYHPG